MNEEVELVEVPADSIEAMAENIKKISEVVTKLTQSGLTERALLVLLRDYTQLPMNTIKTVITGLKDLDYYLQDEEVA